MVQSTRERRHETTDASVPGIVLIAAALAVLLVAISAGLYGWKQGLEAI